MYCNYPVSHLIILFNEYAISALQNMQNTGINMLSKFSWLMMTRVRFRQYRWKQLVEHLSDWVLLGLWVKLHNAVLTCICVGVTDCDRLGLVGLTWESTIYIINRSGINLHNIGKDLSLSMVKAMLIQAVWTTQIQLRLTATGWLCVGSYHTHQQLGQKLSL